MPRETNPNVQGNLSSAVRWLVLLCCVLLGLISEASGGAMSLALRPAARDLHANQTAIQLAALISKMFIGAFMLAGGVIGDIYGRRRIVLWGSAAVLVACLGAALASSTGMLVAARALDGIANAAVGPLSLVLALSVFRPEEQAKVVSRYLGLSVLGVAFGPVAAGWLIQTFGWRAGFALPAVFAIVGALGVVALAPRDQPITPRPRLDGLGTFMSAVGLLGIVYALVLANTIGFILSVEAAAAFDDLTRSKEINDPSLNTWPNTFRTHRYVPAVEYIRAQRARTLVIKEMDKLMSQYDVFISPTTSRSLGLTNLTGHPAIALRAGFLEETPVDFMITGRLYEEATLLRVALAHEQATKWHERTPSLT